MLPPRGRRPPWSAPDQHRSRAVDRGESPRPRRRHLRETGGDFVPGGAMDEPAAIDALLAESRAGLDRVDPADLAAELAGGALVVDTRPLEQRRRDGELPGAIVVDRN